MPDLLRINSQPYARVDPLGDFRQQQVYEMALIWRQCKSPRGGVEIFPATSSSRRFQADGSLLLVAVIACRAASPSRSSPAWCSRRVCRCHRLHPITPPNLEMFRSSNWRFNSSMNRSSVVGFRLLIGEPLRVELRVALDVAQVAVSADHRESQRVETAVGESRQAFVPQLMEHDALNLRALCTPARTSTRACRRDKGRRAARASAAAR